MTSAAAAKSRLALLALLALLFAILAPVPASAATDFAPEGASLIRVTEKDGKLVIDAVDSAGNTADGTIAVGTVTDFLAYIDTSALSAGTDDVQLRWSAPTLPGDVTPGRLGSGSPQAIVTTADDDDEEWLLGTATDAPESAEIAAGEKMPALWRFTKPGSYGYTVTAALVDEKGETTKESAPVAFTFTVSDPDAPDVPDDDRELPAGQSDQPAPASREKNIVGAIHTDAVSVYLDDGELVLQTKADFDADGDGAIDLGTRITTAEQIFHLVGQSAVQVPDAPGYEFLGAPGDTVWLAPQTQDHALIWPGFSTEDPNLTGRVDGMLDIQLLQASGPGDVEVYLQDGGQVRRVFSSEERLEAWQIGIPQHTHMNWAFSAQGTYTLTFEVSGIVDGREQRAQNDYTFVVGDLDAHRQRTEVDLAAAQSTAEAGEGVLFTATVSPDDAVGAVQFRDATSNTVLGHTPVQEGSATFLATALTPGAHEIVAEFVPTWRTDFHESSSKAATITVSGDVQNEPDEDDEKPFSEDELRGKTAGAGVGVTGKTKEVVAGATVSLSLDEEKRAGSWISVLVPEADPQWQGWVQTDLHGVFSVDIPAEAKPGTLRIVVRDEDGELIGWERLTVVAKTDGGSSDGTVPGPADTGTDTSAAVPSVLDPISAAQQCLPGIVLSSGHIDAFYVSAGAGGAVLQLMEDVTGHHVIREAETVLLQVKESAYRTDIPAGTPGAPAGYVLPLTQRADLIWPGWDTNRTSASGYSDVSIHVTGVDGPGTVYLSSQGSFGDIRSLLNGGRMTFPGTIHEATPAHTHAQWVFSQKGIYTLTAHATATNPTTGETLTTAPHTYVFQVGDVPLGDAFCGLRSSSVAQAARVNAAVEDAALQAVAASQAEALAAEQDAAVLSTEQEMTDSKKPRAEAASDDEETESSAAPFVTADGKIDVVAVGVGAGGVLVVAGIAGLTVWYLRRLRREEAEVLSE